MNSAVEVKGKPASAAWRAAMHDGVDNDEELLTSFPGLDDVKGGIGDVTGAIAVGTGGILLRKAVTVGRTVNNWKNILGFDVNTADMKHNKKF